MQNRRFLASAMLSNQHGGIIPLLLILMVVAGITGTNVAFKASGIDQVGRSYRRNLLSRQLSGELKTIFSHPSLCAGLLSITSTSQFSLGDLYHVGQKIQRGVSFTVTNMVMENQSVLPSGFQRADFVITIREDGTQREYKSVVPALFQPSAGGVSFCAVEINTQAACQYMGLVWNAQQSRCQICENLGGTWGNNTCHLK